MPLPFGPGLIKEATGLEPETAERAARHAAQAEQDLRRRLGPERLERRAQGVAELPPAQQSQTPLGRAWALLTVAAALPMLNLRETSKGGLLQAVGSEQNRRELRSQGSVDALAEALRAQAHELVPVADDQKKDASGDDPLFIV